MVFEKVLKGGHFHGVIMPTQISIGKSCATFGKQIKESFKDGFVAVLIDRKNKLVGFEPCDNPVDGYKVHKGSTSTGTFAKELESKLYDAKLEDGIWVIKVSKISENIPTVKINEN